MLARIFSGFLGLLFTVITLITVFDGSFKLVEGKYGWTIPFLGIAFMVYAIGGQTLLRKYFPMWAESEEKLVTKKNENEVQN